MHRPRSPEIPHAVRDAFGRIARVTLGPNMPPGTVCRAYSQRSEWAAGWARATVTFFAQRLAGVFVTARVGTRAR
jgi:hypothetical protein